ncbi:hypothetical protein [Microbacterium gilvum]|uniref:Uncharacterized protein n=1 Tax=Microbacterium gilvum TaxID=1336204 RepID=A0ABP9A6H9_9MICO
MNAAASSTDRPGLATEWSDEHMKRLQESGPRLRKAMWERFKKTPDYAAQIAYDEETERLRRFIRGQQAIQQVDARVDE